VISRALKGLPIPIYGKGVNIREWIFVENHCKILFMLMNEGKRGQIYNIGSGERRSNLEIANLLLDALRVPAKIDHVNDRLGHDFRYALDSSLISKYLARLPLVSLEQGLKHTIAYYEAYGKSEEFEREFTLAESLYAH